MRIPRWKLITYIVVIVVGIIPALPNLLTPEVRNALPDWLPKKTVTLGLDLRGGSHLVLEVDWRTLVQERLQALADDARAKLREAKIADATVAIENESVTVTVADRAKSSDAARALRTLSGSQSALPIYGGQPAIEVATPSEGVVRLTLSESGVRERVNAAIEQSLEIVRRRIDEIGVAEPTIQRVGDDRILVQLPGVQDPSRIKALLGSTAKLTFHVVAPPNSRRSHMQLTLPAADSPTQYTIERRPILTGDRLMDAAPTFDQRTGRPVISFRFDTTGARIFGSFTQSHVGSELAIVLDGKVLSAPVIQEPILGGSGQISGRFTVEEAKDLAALLRAGALPAPLTVIEERTVGADLGSDAISAGSWTGLFGFVLVFVFMMALYGWWGLIANFALALNVALTFGALSLLGATLTLPGIAGIVLGIGLAVDANVLINERIREETRNGRSAFMALDAGFKRAYATIVDSNVTTLIATLLLFMFGSGPVRGFAITMGIGILFSMFTAVSVVRVIMQYVVQWKRPKQLRIEPPVRLFPDGTKIQFMRARYFGIGMSILLSLASVVLFINPGLNYGIDFRGGIQMEVATQGPADLAKLRSTLDTVGVGEVSLQEFGSASRVLIRAERQTGGEEAQDAAVEKMKKAISGAQPGATFERTEMVGPKVSGELAEAGVLSVVLASLAMLAYIWFRFDWPFAVGAIATLILDVTKTVGFFALTGMDFNLTAIAALLTLIGYSVNDKVVVYDRMRENMRLYKQMSLRDLIDKSINETLARSLYTSVTAFLSLLPMAIAGGSAVESFAVPMLFGIFIAASSSVFIAAPILLFLGDWRQKRRTRIEAAAEAVATAGAPPPEGERR
ncbi:MAG: protein translocase subunit SecD [Alphaproteobacteria bacterium]|nr:protein translocase subunit SecD [Alphaproteobacteria bacterium]